KIDVEKSEWDVLSGIEDEDWKKIRQIVIETHDLDDRVEALTTLLRARDYDVYVEQDPLLKGTDLFNIYVMRLPAEDSLAANMMKSELHVQGKKNVSIDELRSFLEERLPHYMIPSHFILMDSLPLTRNGKIDRRSLPLPDNKQQRTPEKYVATRNY